MLNIFSIANLNVLATVIIALRVSRNMNEKRNALEYVTAEHADQLIHC
jgi:hypothetical protein